MNNATMKCTGHEVRFESARGPAPSTTLARARGDIEFAAAAWAFR